MLLIVYLVTESKYVTISSNKLRAIVILLDVNISQTEYENVIFIK